MASPVKLPGLCICRKNEPKKRGETPFMMAAFRAFSYGRDAKRKLTHLAMIICLRGERLRRYLPLSYDHRGIQR